MHSFMFFVQIHTVIVQNLTLLTLAVINLHLVFDSHPHPDTFI